MTLPQQEIAHIREAMRWLTPEAERVAPMFYEDLFRRGPWLQYHSPCRSAGGDLTQSRPDAIDGSYQITQGPRPHQRRGRYAAQAP